MLDVWTAAATAPGAVLPDDCVCGGCVKSNLAWLPSACGAGPRGGASPSARRDLLPWAASGSGTLLLRDSLSLPVAITLPLPVPAGLFNTLAAAGLGAAGLGWSSVSARM